MATGNSLYVWEGATPPPLAPPPLSFNIECEMSVKAVAAEVVDVAATVAQPLLLTIEALPAWLHDNTYILTGYRRYEFYLDLMSFVSIKLEKHLAVALTSN